MATCKHTGYMDHANFPGVFCKANPERQLAGCFFIFAGICLLALLGVLSLAAWALFFLLG